MSRFKRVLSIVLIFGFALLIFACDNLTQENYGKLKVGMSFQEVEKLLGSSTCDAAPGLKNCTWGTAEKNIKVQFVADKVAMYSARGLK